MIKPSSYNYQKKQFYPSQYQRKNQYQSDEEMNGSRFRPLNGARNNLKENNCRYQTNDYYNSYNNNNRRGNSRNPKYSYNYHNDERDRPRYNNYYQNKKPSYLGESQAIDLTKKEPTVENNSNKRDNGGTQNNNNINTERKQVPYRTKIKDRNKQNKNRYRKLNFNPNNNNDNKKKTYNNNNIANKQKENQASKPRSPHNTSQFLVSHFPLAKMNSKNKRLNKRRNRIHPTAEEAFPPKDQENLSSFVTEPVTSQTFMADSSDGNFCSGAFNLKSIEIDLKDSPIKKANHYFSPIQEDIAILGSTDINSLSESGLDSNAYNDTLNKHIHEVNNGFCNINIPKSPKNFSFEINNMDLTNHIRPGGSMLGQINKTKKAIRKYGDNQYQAPG
mmetsp:Transcript_20996/g.21785  ORF Transcript_20996/g.21785 Transcript_20996/m.21785 type:complete len:389 (-) Transcript_20996:77-1243(-)